MDNKLTKQQIKEKKWDMEEENRNVCVKKYFEI